MPRQLLLNRCAAANEQQSALEMAGRHQCSVHDSARGIVAAHGINGYAHRRSLPLKYTTTGRGSSRMDDGG
jgi:hypothetical protein